MRILARFFAVLLIVLTVSPVTAPFAAFDFAELVSDAVHTDADSKLLKETTTVTALVDASALVEHGTAVFASVRGTASRSCQIAPAILRL